MALWRRGGGPRRVDPAAATEFVLLRAPGGALHIAAVPDGARAHDVPRRRGIAPAIAGATFVRTEDRDPLSGWPVFRRRARQV